MVDALEWLKFIELCSEQAMSEPGKKKVLLLADSASWASDTKSANLLQQNTFEMSALIERDSLWGPLRDLSDPIVVIEALKKDRVLDLAQLVLLRNWLVALEVWTQVPLEEVPGTNFKKALSGLFDPYELLRGLNKILTPEGELSENASPQYGALLSELRATKKQIEIVLDQILKSYDQKGYLQEKFSDVHDGRYVIPVRVSSQGQVDGIIYGASSSRQTVFIEPREVEQLNNKVKRLQNEISEEIFRILQIESKRIKPHAEIIESSFSVLIYWDAVQAQARFGRRYGGRPIDVMEERTFELSSTAHPLLWFNMDPSRIIKNSISILPPTRTLLITGPNTGGKTVLLKTLGLAALCARSGFLFPGSGKIKVPFFDQVFADVGDTQSIEQHLSSFSGHILQFKKIIQGLTPRSLILLDELNTATDPEEGAALARSFLEEIMEKESPLTVATTHDRQLKSLGLEDQRILNSSMEFDESTLSPTYRLSLGTAGRSRALEIAQHLGLSSALIGRAKKYLSQEHQRFEMLLEKLEKEVHTASRARLEAERIKKEADELYKKWSTEAREMTMTVLEKAKQKLKLSFEQAREEMRLVVKKLEETKTRKHADLARSRVAEIFDQASQKITSAIAEESPELAEELKKSSVELLEQNNSEAPLVAGDWVTVFRLNSIGTVVENKKGKLKVALGNITMSLTESDVERVSESEKQRILKSSGLFGSRPSVRVQGAQSEDRPQSQIDLRGIRFEEAMRQLEIYLDRAFRSQMGSVTIIHGLGTGALRTGTLELLSRLPYVKTYRDGGPGQGGTGATVVEFG